MAGAQFDRIAFASVVALRFRWVLKWLTILLLPRCCGPPARKSLLGPVVERSRLLLAVEVGSTTCPDIFRPVKVEGIVFYLGLGDQVAILLSFRTESDKSAATRSLVASVA